MFIGYTGTLIENKDILESYADFVFDIVKKAKNDFPMQGNEENIKVVTMLTGAEHLGYWLKLKSNQLGEKVVFKDLLLTVAMVMHLDYFLDTDTIFLTGESKNILKKYLYEKGILSNNTNHLIFIDTGFTGSINKFLNSMIRDMGIKEDFLLLGQYSSPYQEYLAKGLNKQENWKVSDERLNRLILLIDDGFEAAISSPLKFTNGTDVKFLPTNKKWFYELVRKQIESLAKGDLIFEDGLSDKLGNTTESNEPKTEISPVIQSYQLLLQTSL